MVAYSQTTEISLETNLLVRDGLYHADGNNVCEGYFKSVIGASKRLSHVLTNDEGEDKCPDRHLARSFVR